MLFSLRMKLWVEVLFMKVWNRTQLMDILVSAKQQQQQKQQIQKKIQAVEKRVERILKASSLVEGKGNTSN